MAEYIITMKMEINLADYYGQDLIWFPSYQSIQGIINYQSDDKIRRPCIHQQFS